MISPGNFLATRSLAESLQEKGITLVPKPNSILFELVNNVSLTNVYDTIDKDITVDDYLNNLSLNINSIASDSESLYNNIFYSSIEALSKIVIGHISIAKNDVKPLVANFAQEIQQFLERNKVVDPSCELEIISLTPSEALEYEPLINDLKVYKGSSVETPRNILSFAPRSNEELMTMFVTGDKQLDTMNLQWLTNKPNEYLVTIWNEYFVKGEKYIFDNLTNETVFDKADISLVMYLFSCYLFNNPSSDVKTNLTQYQTNINELRTFAGTVLVNSINMINMSNNSNTLIIENNFYKKYIKVNGYVYKKWLAEGGDSSVLLGLLISKESVRNSNLINEMSEKLKSNWSQYLSLYKLNKKNNLLIEFKNFLINSVQFSLSDKTQLEKDYEDSKGNCYETVIKLIGEEIEKIGLPDLEDPYKISLSLIAKCRFYFTNSYEILNDIDEAGRVNPDLSPRDAATVATVYYLLDYLTEQMTVSR